jgi:hypothetical protein
MLAETLAALAAAGGTAVVGAVATDAWQATRAGVAWLLGRGDPDRTDAVEQQLERTRVSVVDGSGDVEKLRAAWTGRLEDLLIERPEAAGQLRELIARAGPAIQQHVVGFDNAQQAVQVQGVQINTFWPDR